MGRSRWLCFDCDATDGLDQLLVVRHALHEMGVPTLRDGSSPARTRPSSWGWASSNGVCCRVRLRADFLWRFGYRQAWAQVQALLDEWAADERKVESQAGVEGGSPRLQVSELHLCADMAGMAVDRLQRGEFVHRGTITSWHVSDAQLVELIPQTDGARTGVKDALPVVDLRLRHGETEGLSFSKTGAHSCAIYNKPREIRYQSRDKVWFADIWRRNGWDGEAPIARIEMRYRRAALHELGCEGVEATFDPLDALWAYSTREWLRHTIPQVGHDTNRSRWPPSPWRQTVQAVDFGQPETAPAQRQRAHAFQEEHLLATIYGYLESWAAYTAGTHVPDDLDLSTVLRAVANRSHAYYATRHSDFHGEVLRKRKRIGFPC
jgi:hypothetical protein